MKLLFVLCLMSLSLAAASERDVEGCTFPAQREQHPVVVQETNAEKVNRLYKKMEGHIFNGDARNKDAGRHTLSSWCAAHKTASGICNKESKLCIFSFGKNKIKTVWNDKDGYGKGNIEALCKASILQNIVQNRQLADRAYMIQTHLKRPICVMHQVSGDGSCYPDGINFRQDKSKMGNVEIGQQCPRGGTGYTVDKREREVVVHCKDVK